MSTKSTQKTKQSTMFRRFLAYYGPERGLFVADTLCALVIAGIDLAFPSILRTLTGGVFTQGPEAIMASLGMIAVGLVVLYLVLCWLGYRSSHRTFTHSVTALTLFSLAVWLVYPPLMPGFAAAFASHLVLDLLNKKGMRILYPLPISPSLGLCYAGGAVNKLLYRLGSIAAVLLTALSVWHWPH